MKTMRSQVAFVITIYLYFGSMVHLGVHTMQSGVLGPLQCLARAAWESRLCLK